MAYLKPPAFQRKVFNKLAMLTGIMGTQTLEVTGRRSGKKMTVPVIPVEYGDARYVVSTRGESKWVKNLRAASGECTIRGRGKNETLLATEIPVEERPPVIEAYKKKAGREVNQYFAKLPDPSDHPTFRITTR